MTPLTSNRRWPLLVLPMLGCLLVLMLVLFLFGLGDVSESFKRFTNALLTSFSVSAAVLTIAMWSYADSRERPMAPIFAIGLMAMIGAILIFTALSFAGDLMLEANGTPMAQILYNIVQLLVIFSAIAIAGGLVLGTAFSLITARQPEPLFNEEE
jgi:hypothetical protein